MCQDSDIPQWVEQQLFEPVLQNIVPNLKEIKDFKAKKSWCSGEIFKSLVLELNTDIELDGNLFDS